VGGNQVAFVEEACADDVELPGVVVEVLGELLEVRRLQLRERVINLILEVLW